MKREPTPQQRAAIEADYRHVCVDAGAGSGKTTVLVDRIIHLLRNDVSLAQIVAITFTRRAAAEMRERLRREIHNAADLNNPKSMTKWRELEYQVQSARITTIDAFCSTLLRENALHLGFDPEFAVLAEAETVLLRADTTIAALEQLLHDGDTAAHRVAAEFGIARLQEFLSACISSPVAFEGALVEYAGLNAGELAELWQRAAGEIQRARRAVIATAPEILQLIADLEALDGRCADATDKREVVRQALLRHLRAVREIRSDDFVREALTSLSQVRFAGGSKNKWATEEDFKRVMELGKSAKELADHMGDPPLDTEVELRAAQLTLDLLHVYRAVAQAYSEAKSARNALDFSDLLAYALRMVETRNDLRDRVARGIRHLLIDEFQDTNHSQLELARRLSRLADKIGADLFIVGDAKQSIYRFRNAEVEVFAEARRLAEKTLPLDENFRSVPGIIAFINDYFDHSGILHAVETQFHRLSARRDPAPDTHIEFLVPDEIGGDAVKNLDAYRNVEADLIAARVAMLCDSDAVRVFDKETKSHRPAHFGDIAVLLRTRSNAEIYDAALRRTGVPSLIVEGSGFYARQEVLDLHNLFAAALDPWNEYALAAFLRGPLACISDDALVELTHDRGLADAVMNGAALRDSVQQRRLQNAVELLRDVWSRREMPLPSLVRHVLERTGFEATLLPQYHGVQKAGNLRKLVDLAEDFSHTGRASLSAFTAYMATVAKRGLREGDAELFADTHGAVRLMTVHSAKGLEFPIVIIADTASQPGGGGETICDRHRRYGVVAITHDATGTSQKSQLGTLLHALERSEDAAEEARVLYVAMTRARDHLLLSIPPVKRRGSWAALLGRHFSLFDRSNGDIIEGDEWRAQVVRSIGPSAGPAREPETPAAALDLSALRAAAAPIEAQRHSTAVLPVSAMLSRLFGTCDIDFPDVVLTASGTDGRALGTAAHAMLERWDFATDPPIEAIVREFCPSLSQRDRFRESLSAIAGLLRRSEMWPRLSNASSMRREVPFTWHTGAATLRGKIDALIDGDLILDFKTGKHVAERHVRNEVQLQLYAAAADAAGCPVREAAIVYLDEGQVDQVDVSESALADLTRRIEGAIKTPDAQTGQSRIPLINAPVK